MTTKARHGRVNIRDVAREAGVSVTTVSRVLSGGEDVVREQTRQKVHDAVLRLNYTVNAHARALAGGVSRTVGFLVREMVGPSFATLASAVESEAAARGHLMMLSTTRGDIAREDALVTVMREQRAAAVLLVGGVHVDEEYETRVAGWADALSTVGSRLVLCGRPALSRRPDVVSVQYDNVAAGRSVTEHLIQLGHRRILFAGRADTCTSEERLLGYQHALRAAGLPIDPGLVVGTGEFSAAGGAEAVNEAVRSGVDFSAVVAVTDVVAVGVLRRLRQLGVSVPEAVSVTGIDDDPQSADLVPALTTVHLPFDEVGRTIGALALDGSHGPTAHQVLPGHLVLRDSTAPPPS